MKRNVYLTMFLLVILIVIFAVLTRQDNGGGYKSGQAIEIETHQNTKSKIPTMSFGNQAEQLDTFTEVNIVKDGDWFYEIVNTPNNKNTIISYSLDNLAKMETIYETNELDRLHQIRTDGSWIYFLEGMGDHGNEEMQLKRVKKDGSETTILMNDIDGYLLRNGKIYYQKTSWQGNPSIYVTNVDGGKKHRIVKINNAPYTINYLIGIYDRWIYYAEYIKEKDEPNKYNIYKIREDGTGKQMVIDEIFYDQENGIFNTFVPENKACYFLRFEDIDETIRTYLVKRTDDGKETIIALGSGDGKYSLNKESEWLYFYENNKLYKTRVIENGKTELVYKTKHEISGVLLFNDEAVLILTLKGNIYIKNDIAYHLSKSN